MVPGTFVIFLVYFLLYFLLLFLFFFFLIFFILIFFLYPYFSDFFVGFIYLVHVFPVLIKTFFFLTNLPIESGPAKGQAGP